MRFLGHWKEGLMDTSNFTQNLIALQAKLYQFAYRLTNNAESARDLLQDTSLAVLDNERLYTPNTNFSAWCHTIMRNLFTNQYRKTQRERAYCETMSNSMLVFHDSTVDSFSDTTEILQVLELLPAWQKESFVLHISGFKYREIAEKLNLPLGTVKSRIFQSKQQLKLQLQDFV